MPLMADNLPPGALDRQAMHQVADQIEDQRDKVRDARHAYVEAVRTRSPNAADQRNAWLAERQKMQVLKDQRIKIRQTSRQMRRNTAISR
jgi:hypothetical protein